MGDCGQRYGVETKQDAVPLTSSVYHTSIQWRHPIVFTMLEDPDYGASFALK